MRLLMVLGLILTLAACGRSHQGYRPGDSFTNDDVLRDRNETPQPLERADKSETNNTPRIEKIRLPIPREQNTTGKRVVEAPPEIEFLINTMKVTDSKISVGHSAGLVRFSGQALLDGKTFPVQLEGQLKEDSTADLKAVAQTDSNFRAEVICNGEGRDGFYNCDSLFVDLYYKISNLKFYREQLELQSEGQKKQAADAVAAPSADQKPPPKAKVDEESEEDKDEVPDPKGTFVGRPERVIELYSENVDALTQEQNPTAASKKVKEQPVGKAVPKQQKPNAATSQNAATSGHVKQQQAPTKKAAPKPVPVPVPAPVPPKPAPVPVQKPAPAPTATAAPKQAPPAPQKSAPAPTATEVQIKEEEPLHPAKVVLEVGDDPNRPTDQAIGGYGGGGRLENASELPFEGENYYFSKPGEQHNYAAYDLIRVVKIFAAKLFNEIIPGVKLRINDFSARHGGYLPPHKGHQNGLEADLGYLTTHSHERVPQGVIAGGRWLGTMLMKPMWRALKFLGGSSRVSLVYVNVGVKPHICSFVKSIGELSSENEDALLTLRKIKPIAGHTSHFHLRMECGRYNPRCRTDGPPAPSTGC